MHLFAISFQFTYFLSITVIIKKYMCHMTNIELFAILFLVSIMKHTTNEEEMSMWTRKALKDNAKAALSRNYWPAVAVSLIIAILGGSGGGGASYSFRSSDQGADIQSSLLQGNVDVNVAAIIAAMVAIFAMIAIAMLIGCALQIFIVNPLLVGGERFFVINGIPEHKATVSELGFGFKDGRYLNMVKTIFLKGLFQWLWSLLLIIPGIVKGYEYRMIPYLLAENPKMDHHTAFAISKKMMNGEKWNAFVLDLSFIGWGILSLFTCGILSVFYVAPYINLTNAQLYMTLRSRLEADGSLAQYELNGFEHA